MLENIKTKLSEEKTQRIILGALGTVATFIVANVVTSVVSKGVDLGIDKLMAKVHPIIEEITKETV